MYAIRDAGFKLPKDVEADMLEQTDEFFGKLYDAMASDPTQKGRLTDVFGDWKPGKK